MKKLFILCVVIIIIPCVVSSFFCFSFDYKFDYYENIYVRVKRVSLDRIDKVLLEDYVIGVVAGEMPVSFEMEALKAQAVAARTYVLKKIYDNYDNEYDVVDTPLNQVYLDDEYLRNCWGIKYGENISKIRRAVSSTRGEVITYDGEIITAFFFSTSSGETENSEEVFVSYLPYLRSVDSSFEEGVSPVFKEVNKYSLEEFYERLGLSYSDELSFDVLETTSTGRIKEIVINGVSFSGNDIEVGLELRSSYFSIEKDDDYVYVITKGYGHGVGMSQYGALALALKGFKYDYIIKYYYQGVEIKKI